MSTRIPELTIAQLAALKLHNIKVIIELDDESFLPPYTYMTINGMYLAQWEYTHQQWDVYWDDNLEKHLELLNKILGPDSAY